MKITKSTRHSKITGDFAEALVLYWLSKYGFECARVDHTGIDLIARNPSTRELKGISVKSRCRSAGTESDTLNLPRDAFEKARAACTAFGCVPYCALVIDAHDRIRVYLLPMERLLVLCPISNRHSYWRMSPRDVAQYSADPSIISFELHTSTVHWWPEPSGLPSTAGAA